VEAQAQPVELVAGGLAQLRTPYPPRTPLTLSRSDVSGWFKQHHGATLNQLS
jgi:hypothetical protein